MEKIELLSGEQKVRRSAAVYFALQSAAVLAWWAMLVFEPATRVYFRLEAGSDASLMAFWLADVMFIGLGSAAASALIFLGMDHVRTVAWLVTGAVSYAAVYTFTFAMITDNGWLGVMLMLAAMVWSGVFAIGVTMRDAMFREARETTTNWVVAKTFLQIAVVWTLILALIPALIVNVEGKIGIRQLVFPGQRPLAAIIFLLISSVGIRSAWVMSRIGKGTPLPLDHAKHLVVAGPYRFVRNPMAVSGICQGLAVALFLGSPLTAAYAVMGSLIWQLIFRPLEEDDLQRRFGGEFDAYRKSVRCWVPKRP